MRDKLQVSATLTSELRVVSTDWTGIYVWQDAVDCTGGWVLWRKICTS